MSAIKPRMKFNIKHLSKGDPLPPYTGRLRLYNMRYCPFAQRAILTLNAKNIDYELVNINLVDKPEWFLSKSIASKVPALEISEGVSITDSLVVAEYLDEAYPQRPLLPKDPVKKAFDKIIIESMAPLTPVMYKLVTAPESVTDEILAPYFKALEYLQSQLQQRGTKFLGGDQPGFADYMIWPWFERLSIHNNQKIKIEGPKYKLLLEYLNNMSKGPIVKEYAVPAEISRTIMNAFREGQKPNYNIVVEE